ncbi:MAG: hypothetical protein ACLT5C_13425 [Blautia hansenii]
MYCKFISLGTSGKGLALKIPKVSWAKRSAIIIGCDNTSGVIHEVIAAHYDPGRGFITRTSGTKEWSVDQETGEVSVNFIQSSEMLVIHTGFAEIKAIA